MNSMYDDTAVHKYMAEHIKTLQEQTRTHRISNDKNALLTYVAKSVSFSMLFLSIGVMFHLILNIPTDVQRSNPSDYSISEMPIQNNASPVSNENNEEKKQEFSIKKNDEDQLYDISFLNYEKLTEKANNHTEHKHHEYTVFDKTQINLGKIDHLYIGKKFVGGSQEPLRQWCYLNLKRSEAMGSTLFLVEVKNNKRTDKEIYDTTLKKLGLTREEFNRVKEKCVF